MLSMEKTVDIGRATINNLSSYSNNQIDSQSLIMAQIPKRYPEKVCCLNLKGNMNVGQIIRTASLFNMAEVFVLGRRAYDKRTTVGMQHYIPVNRFFAANGIHSEKLDLVKIRGLFISWTKIYTLVMVEHGGNSLENLHTILKDLDYSNNKILPLMFIMGSEDHGIPDELMDLPGIFRISIPQFGAGCSFNVSNAFAIVAWEYYRSRLIN